MSQQQNFSPFLQNTAHLYGCYGAIFFCLLSLLNISSFGWFMASFWGYIFGRVIHVIYNFATQPPESVQSQEHSIQKAHSTPIKDKTTPDQTIKKQPLSQEQQLLQHFHKLHYQVIDVLPKEANEKFQNIHTLIVILSQRLKKTHDLETHRAILNIQRIINNYLEPTVHRYQELPVIFHDQKMDNQLSPNNMIIQQLGLIHDELLEITQHVFREDLNALIHHGEFLQQKLRPPQFFKVGKDLIKDK